MDHIAHGSSALDAIIARIQESGLRQKRLEKYRRIMNSIHALGSIYYDAGRFEAYKIIAVAASNERGRKL